ncbi:MAG TPA: PAS domain S-box protein [Phenylobacterium sp.]|uniref:PAS domain S-box protein n=1 Tax=Phenylobacterium sp. TaxID=1871053 RepID=UPI002B6AAD86|nr:PAS domain S-box protein [Phenylobacterium sp.]HXA39036.1 PAS domain S-box protein [Phenylobacterium sp.]
MTSESGNAVAAWQFETFFEVTLDMLCVRDREGRFAKVNQAWERTLGYSAQELEGAYLLPLIHPDDVAGTQAEMERVRRKGEGVAGFINRYRHRDGTYRHLEWRARQVGDLVFAVARDVSERIASEAERDRLAAQLEDEKARLAAVQTVAKIGSWDTDLATMRVQWTAETHRIFETDPAGFHPTHEGFLGLVHPDDRERVAQAFSQSMRAPSDFAIRHRLLLPSGRVKDVEERWQVFADASGVPVRAVGTCQDITERRELLEKSRLQLEAALRDTEAILDNSHDIICTIDPQGRFLRVNRRAEQLWGYETEELVGVDFLDRVHPDDRRSTLKVTGQVMNGSPVGGHMNRCLCKDGSAIPMMWSATWSDAHQMIFAVARDMREHISAEERRRQSQKMEAVGRLTGGVAHDFNNLLTVIIGSTEELSEALAGSPELQAMGRLALGAAERGAELVSRLLAYARNQPLAPESVDCNELLDDIQEMVRRTFAADIEVVLDKAPGELRCLADATQLTTALLNLCINARDAMSNGGRLTIHAARRSGDPDPARASDEPREAYAVLTVEDTGQGMSDETKERAAEPFFTTKMAGEGSGLGLSMVYGFVNQSGGRLEIDSELGSGSRISIYLPESQQDVARAERLDEVLAPSVGARVLLVEDDAMVRSQAERQLRALGHHVTVASDGVEALRLIADCPRFDVVMTDVVMPNGVNGRELAERARALIPDIRVLLTSGHSEDAIGRRGGRRRGDAFLPKPYRRAELERKIALLLQPSGGG